MEENPGKLLTMKEASNLLRVHSNTLRRWTVEGRLPCYRIGVRGDRRFKEKDILDLLFAGGKPQGVRGFRGN